MFEKLGFGFRLTELMPKYGSNFPAVLPTKTPFPYINLPALIAIPQKLIRTWPGLIWMFPSSEAWKETDVLARINNQHYTLQNMEKFFR